MFFKPKYCCNCGEKVERKQWKPWTSPRFCDVCEADYKLSDWLPRAIVLAGVLAGIFGLGTYLQKPEKPLNLVKNAEAANLSGKSVVDTNASADAVLHGSKSGTVSQNNSNISNASDDSGPASEPETRTRIPEQANPSESGDESVHFCGARTKKGKPCTRLVKGGGRCWQHKGMPVLPPIAKKEVGK